MTQTSIIHYREKLYVYSFTTGVKRLEPKVCETDETIQAKCLWLENQGKLDEAEELLEKYCSQR